MAELNAQSASGSANIFSVINTWPLSRKLSLVLVTLLSIGALTFIAKQAQIADYQLLYANMSQADAAQTVSWLRTQKIPYRITGSGTSIEVPANLVHETRLNLASSGLPRGGGVGFEIFDQQNFGMTDFTQKVNYQRALQGELARTISSLAPVEGAKVLLALPKKSLFKDDDKRPTASVIVKIVPGGRLREDQIMGITQLVAGSIERLEAADVTVVDDKGRILTKRQEMDSANGASPGMLSFQHEIEQSLEKRAQSLLDRAVGEGNALVRVTAKIDFSRREQTEEVYDPDRAAARSEQVTVEKSGTDQPKGIPGVASNLKQGGSSSSETTQSSSKTETTNYEITKTVSHTVAPVGDVKKLSVSVLVADKKTTPEGEKPVFVPREANELDSIRNMVAGALGIDKERGDTLHVVSMPFQSTFVESPAGELTAQAPLTAYLPLIKYGLIFIIALLVYFFLIRPVIKTMSTATPTVTQVVTGPGADAAGADQGSPMEIAAAALQREKAAPMPVIELEDPMEKLRNQINSSGATATHVVREWLNA